jgi:hypothetical protein
MKGFEKFQYAMLEAATLIIKPLTEAKNKEAGQALWNHLFDPDGPRETSAKPTGRALYFGKVFKAFLEITHSLETLEDIEFYVGRFPFQNTRISRDRYLQFHIETYFSELYLLQQRLNHYVVLVERQYRRDPQLPEIINKCKNLPILAAKALEGPLRVRHSHVHEARVTDSGIDRLKSIGLLTKSKDSSLSKYMRIHYRLVHSDVKRKWKKAIVKNNADVLKVLDVFFERFFPVVFEERGALKYPSRLKF